MPYLYVDLSLWRLFIADGKDIFSVLVGSVQLMRVFFKEIGSLALKIFHDKEISLHQT
jgi:hypothetical protein